MTTKRNRTSLDQSSLRDKRIFSIISTEGQNALTQKHVTSAHCEQNEKAVIGAALQDPKALLIASSMLSYTDFSSMYRSAIWYSIEKLADQGENVDILSIVNFTRTSDKIASSIGGFDVGAYLAECILACSNPSSVKAYARNVIDFATRWRLAAELRDSVIDLTTQTVNLPDILDRISNNVLQASRSIYAPRTDARAVMKDYWDIVDDLYTNKIDPSIQTGFHELDEKTGGLFPKTVTVLVGEAGRGKTTIALSHVRHFVKQGYRVAYFSLEMSQEEIIRILMAMETGISRTALKKGALTAQQYADFVETAGSISQWSLDIIDDLPTLTPAQMARRIRLMTLENPVDIVIIDGLWLMHPTEPTGERWQDVNQIIENLTNIAKQLDIPILLLHQYKNMLGNRRPELSDISESTGVQKTAQVIWALYRLPKPDGSETTRIKVLKDRNGSSTGSDIEFFYNREYSRYEGGGVQHVSERYNPD